MQLITVGGSTQTQYPTVPKSSWTAFTLTNTAPATGCTGVTVNLNSAEFAAVSLTSTSSGSTNLLSNPNFANGAQTANRSLSGYARPTSTQAFNGATSLMIPAGSSAAQTVTGCVPSTSYTVSA